MGVVVEIRRWPRWSLDVVTGMRPKRDEEEVVGTDDPDQVLECVAVATACDDDESREQAVARLRWCLGQIPENTDALVFTHGFDDNATVHDDERVVLVRDVGDKDATTESAGGTSDDTPDWLRDLAPPSAPSSRSATPPPPPRPPPLSTGTPSPTQHPSPPPRPDVTRFFQGDTVHTTLVGVLPPRLLQSLARSGVSVPAGKSTDTPVHIFRSGAHVRVGTLEVDVRSYDCAEASYRGTEQRRSGIAPSRSVFFQRRRRNDFERRR